MDEKQLNKIQKLLNLNKGDPLVSRALAEVEMAKKSSVFLGSQKEQE